MDITIKKILSFFENLMCSQSRLSYTLMHMQSFSLFYCIFNIFYSRYLHFKGFLPTHKAKYTNPLSNFLTTFWAIHLFCIFLKARLMEIMIAWSSNKRTKSATDLTFFIFKCHFFPFDVKS